MLHEASSVIKAIEKAWHDSGKPVEFTIVILEQGEKNFLGLTKRPAIVSMTYDPRKQTHKNKDFQIKEQRSSFEPKRTILGHKQAKTSSLGQQEKQLQPQQTPSTMFKKSEFNTQQESLEWKKEWVDDTLLWFNDLLKAMNLTTPLLTTKVNKKVLAIVLDKNLIDASEQERMFFISLSYLIMQFLKKKYKKKFKGFHLLIHTKARTIHDKGKPSGS